MSEILIKLTEEEQDLLLVMKGWILGDNTPDGPEWNSIAEKVRRAREDVWAASEETLKEMGRTRALRAVQEER